jgi:hypothetical protein
MTLPRRTVAGYHGDIYRYPGHSFVLSPNCLYRPPPMSAHNPPANRCTDRETSEQHPTHDDGQVSTRILLDSGTPPSCDTCGDAIELKARHKCLTIRDDAGVLREFLFCDDACLSRRQQ